MAAPASRRERRAAWRAVRALMQGGAIDMRQTAYVRAFMQGGASVADISFMKSYRTALAARLADPARPKHAARTAQWRAMWIDPKAGYLARPARP